MWIQNGRRTMRWLVLIVVLLGCNLPLTPLPALTPEAAATPSPFAPVSDVLPTPTLTIQPSATLSPQPEPTIVYQPVFEPAACNFSLPAGQSPLCGYLLVPENRTRAGSPLIRLHVAVFPTRATNPAPEPVVHLAGGPGSSSLGLAQYLFDRGLGAVLDERDLILFDQRGTGVSHPRLDCPERQALTAEILARGIAAPENEAAIVDAFTRCHDRLAAEGVDLSAYTSTDSAADVADLARALGYPALNLYGVSYGTRLALTVMRDHPQVVRSAVLDSVYPLQVDLYTPLAANAERAFDVFFDEYSAGYPNLRTDFYTLVAQLNAQPRIITLQGSTGSVNVRLDGGLLIDVLFVGLYNPAVTARMPDLIDATAAGEYSLLRDRLWLYFDDSPALGMQMAMQCSEEIPFASAADADAQAQGVQADIAAFYPASVHPLFAACPVWQPAMLDLRENQPVTSSAPALILSGAHDPITPPDWGRMVHADLSQSYFYEFPGNGHWVTRSSSCALNLALAFWRTPHQPPAVECEP